MDQSQETLARLSFSWKEKLFDQDSIKNAQETRRKRGANIIMTLTAFMTEEAWKTMTPSLVKGLRKMPIVKANPWWWML